MILGINMLKDFFYLWFWVGTKGTSQVFINHKKAKEYYHRLGDVNKSYGGLHLWNGVKSFHITAIDPTVTFNPKYATDELIKLNIQYNVDGEL
tara:strand:- start:27022 stop:27300 length:279 start_codon:yes stop_codon:yes gene_type:complete